MLGRGPIGWALRCLAAWAAIAVVAGVYHGHLAPPQLLRPQAAVAAAARVPSNRIVYRADPMGHVAIEAAVNGAPVTFLLDTGASLVSLPVEAAEAAGIDRRELVFDRRAATANGIARVAPVMLREIRIDQLAVEDVPAVVIDKLHVPLLGMSFLKRLKSYEMRDGELIVRY
jgi:aspartyl protease family protein